MAAAFNADSRGASRWGLVPALVVMLVFFWAYAIFIHASFLPAGTSGQMVRPDGEFTWDNYIRYFKSPSDLMVLVETLWISFRVMVVCFVLGYPVAYVIVRTQSQWLRNGLFIAVIMTFLSGSITRAYSWLVILGNRGLVNSLLMKLGVIAKPLQLVYNETGVFIALLHFVLPFFILTMMGPLKNVHRNLEDAAINLGASRLQTYLRVTLPLSMPGIVAACSLSFAISLSTFAFPLVLGGGRMRMVANSIYENIFSTFNVPYAAAIATVFLVIALFFVWLFSYLQNLSRRGRLTGGH
ncbi:ABC transporter permease [Bordetella sp. N]|uniref:ABC transporter permease n=1 Tax=Bordetella sp. N TaxID=1746199 RepID=UPI000708BBE6|nr:ABC transporter permease [Bordetella sp. N]ALM85988.1 hypothetical protein ASB57_26270 [Bordetella sp. N]